MKNPYDILEISSSANEEEIKKSYRKLSKQYHPDRNPGDEEADKKYKEIQQAYSQLTNKQSSQRNHDTFVNDEAFSSFFSSFFNVNQRSVQGHEVNITFLESLLGVKKSISYSSITQCRTCFGQGNDPSCTPTQCDECGGLGRISLQQGNTIITRKCSKCIRGMKIDKICVKCLGSGEIAENNNVEINIPAGSYDGMRVKLSEGNVGIITVEKCKYCNRREFDLIVEAQVSLSTAIFGGTVFVPSSAGLLKVKVPSDTQPGSVLRIREKGFVHPEKSVLVGDLYVKINVCLPDSKTINDLSLLKEVEDKSEMNSLKKFEEFTKLVK